MNLVDVDKLKELIADPDDSARYGYLSMFDLEDAEIIETQPVRHGKWKEEVTHNGCTPDYDCVCSECGSSGLPYRNYCHNCGAKMDKE